MTVDRFFGAREEYPALGWGIKAALTPWGPRLQLLHEQDGFWNLEDSGRVSTDSTLLLGVDYAF